MKEIEEYQEFINYQLKEGYAKSTIKHYLQCLNYLENWYRGDLRILRDEDLINYVNKLQREVKPQTINRRLSAIKVYFNYLQKKGEVRINVAQNIQVRNEYYPLETVFSEEELNTIYQSYEVDSKWKMTKKVLLGLVIYQGIPTPTLKKMKREHVDLERCELYVPETMRSNSRRLSIKSVQVLTLSRYLEHHEGDTLFKGSKSVVTDHFTNLLRELKRDHKQLKNISHLRKSVIKNWLKRYNLREVQYYCGHKHIGSTESYQSVDLEGLKADLNKYHLLS